MRFSFHDFLSVGEPSMTSMTRPELHSAHQMQSVCVGLIKELGGIPAPSKVSASHIVLYQAEAPKDRLSKYRPDQKVINYRYITECYFQMMRLKLDEKTPSDFKVPF